MAITASLKIPHESKYCSVNLTITNSVVSQPIKDPESVDQARATLAEFFGRFTLDPTNQAGEACYTVRGEVVFFGGEGWRERVVPGARIELATPAFSGRRSTSELPRHAGVC